MYPYNTLEKLTSTTPSLKPGQPPIIPAKGIDIKDKIISQEENIFRFDVDFNLDQFYSDMKQYRDGNGFVKAQIVKRRKPSPKGHNWYMRIRSSINDAA